LTNGNRTKKTMKTVANAILAAGTLLLAVFSSV
jgi:hypothetical protein